MKPNRILRLTTLTDCDSVAVLVEAIDAVHCCPSKVPGTMLYLRSGDILKVRETPDEVVRLMLLGD